jgi:hypothetical protein
VAGVVEQPTLVVRVDRAGRIAVAFHEVPFTILQHVDRGGDVRWIVAGVDVCDPRPRFGEADTVPRPAQLRELIAEVPDGVGPHRLPPAVVLRVLHALDGRGAEAFGRPFLVRVLVDVVDDVRLREDHVGPGDAELIGDPAMREVPRGGRAIRQVGEEPLRRRVAHHAERRGR